MTTYLTDREAEQAQAKCDGGTCGLGGYCEACPKAAQAGAWIPAPPEFDEWFDADDGLSQSNPFALGTPAYWALEGWIAAKARAAQAVPAEPVATVRVHKTGGNAGLAWSAVPTDDAPLLADGMKLYVGPQPVAAQQPLTDEQVAEACGWKAGMGCKPLPHELRIARAIEQAHGIGAAAPKEQDHA